MENKERGHNNRELVFSGTNCVLLKVRMKTYTQSLGAFVWDAVKEEYQMPQVSINRDEKMDFAYNDKAMKALLVELPE